MNTKDIIQRAYEIHTVVPAFNIPHLPMMKAVAQAIRDENSFALIQVARLEWIKFESKSLKAVREEYELCRQEGFTRLHLDHVPVIDEDHLEVDFKAVISEALELGYQSVMVDGSRLSLDANIEATRAAAALAHSKDVPCEAELGAVLGHESGPLPPYDEIFASGEGFTKLDEAERFVKESGCDWLSVAVGNIHGAISGAASAQKKPQARLNVDHIANLRDVTGVPLVLHGGSGIQKQYIMDGIKNGISKINVGTEIRQAYSNELKATGSVEKAQEATYHCVRGLLHDFFEISNNHDKLGL